MPVTAEEYLSGKKPEPKKIAEDYLSGAPPGESVLLKHYPLLDPMSDIVVPAPLATQRMEPDVQPASSTKAGIGPEQSRAYATKDQSVLKETTLDLREAIESVGSGFVSGLLDIEGDPTGSVMDRMIYKWRGQPSHKIGEFLGVVTPYGAAAKGVSYATRLPKVAELFAKMPTIVSYLTKSASTAALYSAGRQTLRSIAGEDVNWGAVPKDMAWVTAIDIGLRGAGAVGKQAAKLFADGKLRAANRLIQEAIADGRLSDDPKEALESFLSRGSKVVRDMKVLPLRWVTSSDRLNLSMETSPRTFDRLGTVAKEFFWRPAKRREHLSFLVTETDRKALGEVKKGISWKQDRDVNIYSIAQQGGGAEALKREGLTAPAMNEKQQALYDHMNRVYEEKFLQLNEMLRSVGLPTFGKQANYATFWNTVDNLIEDGHTLLSITDDAVTKGASQVGFRFAKSRSGEPRPLTNLAASDIFNRYVESANYHIQMTPLVNRFRRLIDAPVLQEETRTFAEQNPEAYKFVNGWINTVAGQRFSILPAKVENIVRRANKNMAFAVLSANLRSAAIQPTAYVSTVAEIGPRWGFEGLRALADPNKFRFAMKNSNVLLGRQFESTVVDAVEGLTGRWSKGQRKVAEFGLKPLQALDQVFANATWYGAYQKAIRKFQFDHQAAANYADDIVISTQASASRLDISPIQRETLGKTATMFNTFVINQWGWLRRDMLGIGGRGVMTPETLKKTLTFVATMTAVTSLFEDVIGTRSPFPSPITAFNREKERSDSDTKAAWEAMREMLEVVPVVGGALRYGSSPYGAQAEYLTQALKIVSGREGRAEEIFETLGKTFGLPGTTEIKKKYKYVTEEE